MRAVVIAMVGSRCGAATSTTPPQPPRVATLVEQISLPPAPEPVPAKGRTLERYSGRDLVTTHLSRDEVILLDHRMRSGPMVADVAEIDFLGPCARTFVQAQPEAARRVVVEALTHYVTSCRSDGAIVLERPLGFDSRDRRSRSDVAFAGVLAPYGGGLVLRVVSCGS